MQPYGQFTSLTWSSANHSLEFGNSHKGHKLDPTT